MHMVALALTGSSGDLWEPGLVTGAMVDASVGELSLQEVAEPMMVTMGYNQAL